MKISKIPKLFLRENTVNSLRAIGKFLIKCLRICEFLSESLRITEKIKHFKLTRKSQANSPIIKLILE